MIHIDMSSFGADVFSDSCSLRNGLDRAEVGPPGLCLIDNRQCLCVASLSHSLLALGTRLRLSRRLKIVESKAVILWHLQVCNEQVLLFEPVRPNSKHIKSFLAYFESGQCIRTPTK